MKNPFFVNAVIAFMLIIGSSFFFSCHKQPSLCDPETFYWSEKTKAYYENASIEEYIGLPYNKQRALYSKFSPSKRLELWRAKVNRVRSEGTLSPSEMEDYASFIYGLTPDCFSAARSCYAITKSEEFAEMMHSKYGWEDIKVVEYLYSWLTLNEWKDAIIFQSLSMNLRGKEDTINVDTTAVLDTLPDSPPSGNDTTVVKKCDCTSDNACVLMVGFPQCQHSGCNDTQFGCGFLGMSSCTGICQK